MNINTITSRQINQDMARAKKLASTGPVFITNRGKPAHVLLSIEDYRQLAGSPRSLLDALSMAGLAEVDFEPPRMEIRTPAVDLA